MEDRITRLRVAGLRTLADVTLDLDGLSVLVGENGVGKSSLVEACELLRRVPRQTFLEEFQSIHGGFRGLLRRGTRALSLAVYVDGPEGDLEYELLLFYGYGAELHISEYLGNVRGEGRPKTAFFRRAGSAVFSRSYLSVSVEEDSVTIPPDRLALHSFGVAPPHPAVTRMLKLLEAIEVHLPFQTLPRWGSDSRHSVMRDSVPIQSATRLERFGANLPNAFHTLKNEKSDAHWRETMDYVRLGLGDDVESINTRPDASGGYIALTLKRRGVETQEPAYLLSEGQLAYLAFVALFRLEAPTSLLVFDEPELHLHPQLMARVLGFFESIGERAPVLLATHSDRLLDSLENPAKAAVLCELDENRATRLLRPDPEALAEWLKNYRGLGDLRSAGYESAIFTKDQS